MHCRAILSGENGTIIGNRGFSTENGSRSAGGETVNVLERIESVVTDIAAKVGPMIAPIPTAYAIGTSVVENLAWPVWVAILAGGAIELLGLATVNTALTLREYNANKRKSDPRAPFGLAASLAGVYLVVAVALAVVLDVVEALATWTPAIFPLLSLCGVTVLAVRSDHRRRVSGIAEAKAEASRKRAERRNRKRTEIRAEAGRKPAGTLAEMESESIGIPGSPEERKTRAKAILARDPDVSGTELGRRLGVSGRQGRNLKAELLPEMEIGTSAIGGNGTGNGRH
jgi:hypothetical protein